MWRALLADRMKLPAHYEVREKAGYELLRSRKDRTLGPGLKPSTLDCTQPPQLGPPSAATVPRPTATMRCGTSRFDPDETTYAGGITMAGLARMIGSMKLRRPVVDRTGPGGFFAVTLRAQWRPDRP